MITLDILFPTAQKAPPGAIDAAACGGHIIAFSFFKEKITAWSAAEGRHFWERSDPLLRVKKGNRCNPHEMGLHFSESEPCSPKGGT